MAFCECYWIRQYQRIGVNKGLAPIRPIQQNRQLRGDLGIIVPDRLPWIGGNRRRQAKGFDLISQADPK